MSRPLSTGQRETLALARQGLVYFAFRDGWYVRVAKGSNWKLNGTLARSLDARGYFQQLDRAELPADVTEHELFNVYHRVRTDEEVAAL